MQLGRLRHTHWTQHNRDAIQNNRILISNGSKMEFGYRGKEVSDLVYRCNPEMIVLLLRHGAKIEIWKYKKELDERYDSVILNYLVSFGQSINEEVSLYKTPLIKAVHF